MKPNGFFQEIVTVCELVKIKKSDLNQRQSGAPKKIAEWEKMGHPTEKGATWRNMGSDNSLTWSSDSGREGGGLPKPSF